MRANIDGKVNLNVLSGDVRKESQAQSEEQEEKRKRNGINGFPGSYLNRTPFVRPCEIMSNKWGDFYAKGSTEQTIHVGIQEAGRGNYANEKLSCRETARQFEINNHKCVGAWEPIRLWIFQPDRRRSGHPGSGGRRRRDPQTAIRIGSAVSPAPAAIFRLPFHGGDHRLHPVGRSNHRGIQRKPLRFGYSGRCGSYEPFRKSRADPL